MKNLCLILCLLTLAGCTEDKPQSATEAGAPVAPLTVPTNLPPGQTARRFEVKGMTCEGCVGGLRSELLSAAGVKAVEISLKGGQAVVVFETNRTGVDQLVKVIKEAGLEGKPLAP